MVRWQEVAAFIGPLIAAIAVLGGFIGWLMTRMSKFVRDSIANVQAITNERIKTLTEELAAQNRILERLQVEQQSTAVAVARIEGSLSSSLSARPNPHE